MSIGAADAVIVYSGSRSAFDLHGQTLRSLGAGTTCWALMWGIGNGFLQGAALLGAAGVDAAAFVPPAKQGIETVTGRLYDAVRLRAAGPRRHIPGL
ncbi:hypothetical protein [Streptomyces sp. AC555_RSS877]|uniref:imine reductase family protein n=1 Tax=Streptomyces sp. AC555_RSS877 TaxID=2823688 RepID=UPI001C27ED3E|nr:hypothetical protein [Streptomyces sp. AC555_RSS877]